MIIFQSIFVSAIFVIILLIFAPSVLLTGSTAVSNDTHSMFNDFKAVLMYFSEAFLKGAEFGNRAMEGETDLVMPKKLLKVLRAYKNYGHNFETLRNFKEDLNKGTIIALKISNMSTAYSLKNFVNMAQIGRTIQVDLINSISTTGQRIVIPSGWVGHSIALIIKNAGVDGNNVCLYDLTVINTGSGINYHYHRDDPENVYPYLSRLWIEFKSIPENLIFDPVTAWFFCALASIKQPAFATRLQQTFGNDQALPNYFYGSLLSNFKNYLVKPGLDSDESKEKLFPEQRSGSCTMSSLLGALLYYSESLEAFHSYRLNLGHFWLNNFLDNLNLCITTVQGSCSEFTDVLTNGFLSGGMKLFKGLVRALASQQLQYLEYKFPEEFKHAGLIGSGRSTWIAEKKNDAIEKLSNDSTALNELKVTIVLAKRIINIASSLQARHETTHVTALSEVAASFEEIVARESVDLDEADKMEFFIKADTNIYRNLLAGQPERLEFNTVPVDSFEEFYNEFQQLFLQTDDTKVVYFLRFLDLFKRLHAYKGWPLIYNHQNKNQLLHLQELCRDFVVKYLNLANEPDYKYYRKPSLDEITLLGHMQLLSWNLFRALHVSIFQDSRTNWDELAPPQSVQSILLNFGSYKNLLSGAFEDFPIKGFNDMENYKLYTLFIKDGRSDSANNEHLYSFNSKNVSEITHFPGPESLSWDLDKIDKYNFSRVVEGIMKNKDLKEGIFHYFLNLAQLDAIIEELKTDPKDGTKWQELNPLSAKFWALFCAGQEQLYAEIPHFYNLMFTLDLLRKSLKGLKMRSDIKYGEKFWTMTSSSTNNIGYTAQLGFFGLDDINGKQKFFLSIKDVNTSPNDAFFYLCHSRVLVENNGEIGVDIWLNYIKGARNSKLFDEYHFQCVTDHLLNIPKYGVKSTGSYSHLMIFDGLKAKTIILELTKMVNNTLTELYDDSDKMIASRRELIVKRAVNISVILTRFISRVNYEFRELTDPVDWSPMLASLYNTIEDYSHLNSNIFKLNDLSISRLHFALSHICRVSMYNFENFIQHVKLGFEYQYEKYSKTMERLHWFMAKMNYMITSNNLIADDQFKYVFGGSPLEKKELRFLEALLKNKFLNDWNLKESDYTFQYDSAGYSVEINSVDAPGESSKPRIRMLINLSTGEIIENGLLVVGKSQFVNSDVFQSLFDSNDHNFLANYGKAFAISGVPVFILPIFKSSDYFMIKHLNKYWALRKWNNSWYIWRPRKVCQEHFGPLSYSWTGNKIKMFKKYQPFSDNIELTIFDEHGKDPIIQLTKGTIDYEVSVPGLTDEISATILNQKDLEMHLKEFAEDGIILARRKICDTFVVIFNSYRFAEDPSKPFVITSSKDDNILRVRNLPNMEICKDQRIGKEGLSLPGSLVASLDGKKVLLLPFAEVLKKSQDFPKNSRAYINIEKIPAIEVSSFDQSLVAMPAPQSRKHKLLLAYYLVLAHIYDSARKLLHPSTAIHQNEAFSKDELQVLIWILRIESDNPEFNALKLLALTHLHINQKKFVFYYDDESTEMLKEVHKYNISTVFNVYMMAIRELSEKYNIFKIFPEILMSDSSLNNEFFSAQNLLFLSGNNESKFEFPTNDIISEKFKFGEKVLFSNFIHLLLFFE